MWNSDQDNDRPSGPAPGQTGIFRPAVDAYDTGRSYIIKADLPGFAREEIVLEVHEGELILLGQASDDQPLPLVKYHLLERARSQFARKIDLPDGLDLDLAEAFLCDGVLSVVIPKKDQTRMTFKVDINVL